MLMKKIWFLMLGLLAMVSCEQEDLDSMVKGNAQQVQTRAATSAADFDPVNELNGIGIPLNIINVGNNSRKYLSCVKSGDKVDLFTKDDGSMRQRWQIFNGSIALIGGNSMIPPPLPIGMLPQVYIVPNSSTGETYPKLGLGTYYFNHGYETLGNGNCYIYRTPNTSSDAKYYLQSETKSGAVLKYKNNPYTDLAQWKFVAIGEYEIVDLEYVMTSVDNLTPKEVFSDYDVHENTGPAAEVWDYSVSIDYTETSSFSQTIGVSASITNSISVGLPNVGGSGTSIGLNTSIQQQSSKSWTFGTTGSKKVVKTRTGHVTVPPNTKVRTDAFMGVYEGKITYVATLRKIGDTRTFRVKGYWEGGCFSYFKTKTYEISTGTVIATSIE